MNILIFGVQGSGKSTVGRYIAKKLNIPFIATGDIFRKLREEQSTLGGLVRDKIDKGFLVLDEPTMGIVNQRLNEKDTESGFVLDGAPRNLKQVEMLNKNVDLLVLVNLDKKEAISRLLNRARHDDTREAIEKRISWYEEQTKPVIDYYKGKNVKVTTVDNMPAEDLVRKKVDDLFEEF